MKELPEVEMRQMSPKTRDLTGVRFGRLLVTEFCGYTVKDQSAVWKSRCDCGDDCYTRADVLLRGNSNSCGCYQKEVASKTCYRHGMYEGELYGVWEGMKKRCLDKNFPFYYNYGGRGITVCDEWLNFENFYNDMYPRPSDGHQIDRIDNDKGYYKENCRWVSPRENGLNRGAMRGSTSKHRGVIKKVNSVRTWWEANISFTYGGDNRVDIRLGSYDKEDYGGFAYDLAFRYFYGDKYHLNNVQSLTFKEKSEIAKKVKERIGKALEGRNREDIYWNDGMKPLYDESVFESQ